MLQFIGTVAVVVSVLVLAYQTRDVARQTRLANQVASTDTLREQTLNLWRWSSVFIEHPRLHSMYFGETTTEPSEDDRVRLGVIGETHADWLETVKATKEHLETYDVGEFGEIHNYVEKVIASTPGLRKVIRDQPGIWPSLTALVARHDEQEQHGV
jgi:hypothetical protein